mgnify:CR=1 FL=1
MLVKPIDISVVVPVYNEYESLPELEQWIDRVMKANKFSYQLILIDDGSTDKSGSICDKYSKNYDNIITVFILFCNDICNVEDSFSIGNRAAAEFFYYKCHIYLRGLVLKISE